MSSLSRFAQETDILPAYWSGMTELLPLIYDDLRALAAHYLVAERKGHTLRPTELVHEAYLRMVHQGNVQYQNRAHFFALCATMMRRILLDYARARAASKRGDGQPPVVFDPRRMAISLDHPEELLALDEALCRLAEIDSRQSAVVELRFFGGLTLEEAGEELGVAPMTVKRDWSMARAWLLREMSGTHDSERSMAPHEGAV